MAIPHAKPGDVINVRPLGPALAAAQTEALVKTPTLEVLRLVLPPGKEVCHEHAVAGEVLVHCLEGRIDVRTEGESRTLGPGQMLYIEGGRQHTLCGVDHASALLTILLR